MTRLEGQVEHLPVVLKALNVLGGQRLQVASAPRLHAAVRFEPAWHSEHDMHALAPAADHDEPSTHDAHVTLAVAEQFAVRYWPAPQPAEQAVQGA